MPPGRCAPGGAGRRDPPGRGRRERAPPRPRRAAHVRLLLGAHEPGERPGTGPLAHAVVLERRGGRFRADRYRSAWKGATSPGGGAGAGPGDARFLSPRRRGPPRGDDGLHKGFFYHFLDMKTGSASSRSSSRRIDTTLLVAGVPWPGPNSTRITRRRPRSARWRTRSTAASSGTGRSLTRLSSTTVKPEVGFLPTTGPGELRRVPDPLRVALGSPTHPIAPGPGPESRRISSGRASTGRSTSRSMLSSDTSTRTSGSTSAGSGTTSPGRTGSTTSRIPGARRTPTARTRSRIRRATATTERTSGA